MCELQKTKLVLFLYTFFVGVCKNMDIYVEIGRKVSCSYKLIILSSLFVDIIL